MARAAGRASHLYFVDHDGSDLLTEVGAAGPVLGHVACSHEQSGSWNGCQVAHDLDMGGLGQTWLGSQGIVLVLLLVRFDGVARRDRIGERVGVLGAC